MKAAWPLDMNKQEIQNARIQNLASAPGSPVAGQLYYDTGGNLLYFYNGTSWISAAGGGIPVSLIDAKGDLIVGTANDTAARKAVGSDGTLLVADSAQGDGLLWRVLADADIPSTLFRDAEHTTALHQEILATADLTDWPRTAALDLNSQKITSLLNPTADQDAATKQYVDGLSAGISWKDTVRVATTANGTLATAFENGDTVDGVALATGDRILIKDQSAPAENGIYVVNASGAPTRATDADSSADLLNAAAWVAEGTANADQAFVGTANGPITVNTTALPFVQFSGLGQVTAGTGLTKSGNTLDAGAGTGIVANANDIAVLRTDANGRVALRFSMLIGDTSATSFNVDHNLNSLDVIVQVYEVSTGRQVEADIVHSTVNRVVVQATPAPATNALSVVVIG